MPTPYSPGTKLAGTVMVQSYSPEVAAMSAVDLVRLANGLPKQSCGHTSNRFIPAHVSEEQRDGRPISSCEVDGQDLSDGRGTPSHTGEVCRLGEDLSGESADGDGDEAEHGVGMASVFSNGWSGWGKLG